MSSQVLVGFHAVSARARYAPDSIKEVYIEASRRDKRMQTFADQLRSFGCRVIPVESFRLNGLAKGLKHQGVVAIVDEVQTAQSIEDVLEDCEGVPFFLVLDNITDPHNLGACLRTADAAGVTAVIAPKDRSAGLNATVKRVACGAAETVPYITVTNLARTLKYLQQQGVWVVGTDDQASQTLHDVDAKMPIAWVLGAEGEGMRRLTKETCDELVAIPMLGAVESLNVSVASAVCLYETVRQRR